MVSSGRGAEVLVHVFVAAARIAQIYSFPPPIEIPDLHPPILHLPSSKALHPSQARFIRYRRRCARPTDAYRRSPHTVSSRRILLAKLWPILEHSTALRRASSRIDRQSYSSAAQILYLTFRSTPPRRKSCRIHASTSALLRPAAEPSLIAPTAQSRTVKMPEVSQQRVSKPRQ